MMSRRPPKVVVVLLARVVVWLVSTFPKAWLWRANWRARFGFQLGQFFNPPSWVEDAGAVSPSVLHIGSVCFLKIWNNEKSSNQSSFLRYLPLFWPAEQLRADVESNLSQPQKPREKDWKDGYKQIMQATRQVGIRALFCDICLCFSQSGLL